MGMRHVQAVSGAGVVRVIAPVALLQAIIRSIVDALETEHGAQMVAFGRVVVDHVQDHLDSFIVQHLDHLLEFLGLLARLSGARVFVVGGEVSDGAVSPVISQAFLDEVLVMDELVNRHELNGGDPHIFEIPKNRRVRECGIRAPDSLGDVRVSAGEPLDVDFIDDCLVERTPYGSVFGPVEVRIHHHRPWCKGSAVAHLDMIGLLHETVGKHCRIPPDLSFDRPGVWVEQELGRIEPEARKGVPGAVYPKPVPLPRSCARQVDVPAVGGHLGKIQAGLFSGVVEKAELNPLSRFRENGEVRSEPVECCTQRIRFPRPDFHNVPLFGAAGDSKTTRHRGRYKKQFC
ncbi:MAG: hypothetical protein BWZ01_03195 [Deltaproteobacteria bacterium ADurb.BinA179]|nr:MAG: hypothetical protein BWZ01_03195 [Deltaproteobacteria bacterium ADurb.BinA179]